MKLALTLILLGCCGILISQDLANTVTQQFMDNLSSQPYYQTELEFDNRFKGVLGTPLWFDDWKQGKLQLESGESFEGLFNYDAYEDQLIYAHEGKKTYTVKKSKVSNLQIAGSYYLRRPNYGYLQRLTQGSTLLLAKRAKRLRKASLSSTYSTNQDYHRFIDESEYFLEINGGLPIKAPKTVSGFIKLFPQHKTTLKEFAKEHRLFLQRESDLVELTRFCNSLAN
jgi:hypothetical protein